MPVRVPPGRAGRLWLLRRIDVVRRGAGVLDRKRQALVREEHELRLAAAAAEREWRDRADEAATWLRRAAVVAGRRPLGLARSTADAPATVDLDWRSAVGVRVPVVQRVSASGGRRAAGVGSASIGAATVAHRRALEAAAAAAAVSAAHRRVAAELERTLRRQRALERRWLPEHEKALAALELRLDEDEREEAVRTRWVREHEASAGRAMASIPSPPTRPPD